jgi:hypothetical protein
VLDQAADGERAGRGRGAQLFGAEPVRRQPDDVPHLGEVCEQALLLVADGTDLTRHDLSPVLLSGVTSEV